MTTSLDAPRRTPRRPGGPQRLTEAPAVVRVPISGRGRRALCTCGWVGRWRRLLHSRSVLDDALIHAADVGCQPAVPLVAADVGRPP